LIEFHAPRLLFGAHATAEIGHVLRRLGVGSTMIVTDATVNRTGVPERVRSLVEAQGIGTKIVDSARVEPTDLSCQILADSLAADDVESFVAVGGGSAIDTAKVLNLLLSNPGTTVREFLNAPIGDARPVPGPLRPLVAVPTTAGSSSECTAMVALGVVDLNVKTGIADRALTPAAAVVDPLNTVTVPAAVTASGGYDVLTHACESYTTRPYDRRPGYASPDERPIYIGANPISDIWAEQALMLIGRYLVRAVLNPDDLEARTGMCQAAIYAGMGFGNSGTHIPHACAYPIAGLVRDYRPRDYQVDHVMVPHGEAVVSTAAAAFRFTYDACPERHVRAAQLLGAPLSTGADALPAAIATLVAATGGPRGISAFGYRRDDVPLLVEGAAKQVRLLSGAPRRTGRAELADVFAASLDPIGS
jgi:alcohol dehydrogenase class IV